MPNDDEPADSPHASEDERLARLARICEAFAAVERERRGAHSRLVVRKKTFAYFLDDHHDDGIVSLCVTVAPSEHDELIASDPQRFYRGANGWVALRLEVDERVWDEVAAYAAKSYRLIAPTRLAAQGEGD
jgi:phosphoribosylglycinamide formyltransferase-1